MIAICLAPADAQRRKAKKVVKPKVEEEVVPEKTPQEELFEELLPSTAQVMFIDSVVVDKADFLSKMQFTHEMGKVVKDGERVYFVNEFGNTQVIASGNADDRSLFMAHKYGSSWDTPTKLTELGNASNDYPFLMTDGVTLYFSAEGENTVGGRDIFRTTFDAEESHFYEAVNMGMPFNSPANDYLLAISDYDNLGWLVSDRFQPEGKVCIYTFEPTDQRKTFDEDTEPEELMPYAWLCGIERTWKFGNRKDALNRKLDMLQRSKNKQTDEKVFFVVNDDVVYNDIADFKNPEDAATYKQIAANRKKLEQTKKLLDMTRDSYAMASAAQKTTIGRNILQLETEVTSLERTLKKAEKTLRNNLNK